MIGGGVSMVLQARKLDLHPRTQPVSSLLYSPPSRSLALTLSDSSILLYPDCSVSNPVPVPIPPLSTAACFLRTLPSPRLLFLTASPAPSANTLLRVWAHRASAFTPARLSYKQYLAKSALPLDLAHGMSLRMAGGVNVLVLHAHRQIWVFSVRFDAECGTLSLNKCAVITCALPVYTIALSAGFLLLGEVAGVRVFPLRPLIKGGSRERAAMSKNKLPNGVVVRAGRGKRAAGGEPPGSRVNCYNGGTVVAEKVLVRHRTAKVLQNSGDYCSIFIEMRSEVQNTESGMGALASVKAVTIRELSQKTFLILDSIGDVHLLSLQNTVKAPEASRHPFVNSTGARICRLSYTMKVQMLAVLPDISNETPVIWISDGGYSVHMVSIADMESSITEDEKDRSEEKAMHISALQAIFTSDKVQDVVPLSANAVLVLGKGNIFSYAIA